MQYLFLNNTPTVAILGGGGLMGRDAVRLCAVSGMRVLSFDLPGRAQTAVDILLKKQLLSPRQAAFIICLESGRDFDQLTQAHWVGEFATEDHNLKMQLLAQAAEYLKPGVLGAFTTNTSGKSIGALSVALPDWLQQRFFGAHFFNKIHMNPLLEMIKGYKTTDSVFSQFSEFAESRLNRRVVVANDTPNFGVNRFLCLAMNLAFFFQKQGMTPPVMDSVFTLIFGWPFLRVLGTVGVDTAAMVLKNVTDKVTSDQDPFVQYFALPPVLQQLIDLGYVGGAKSDRCFYEGQGKSECMFDPPTGGYVPVDFGDFPQVEALLKQAKTDPMGAFTALMKDKGELGDFARGCFGRILTYAFSVIDETFFGNYQALDTSMEVCGWKYGPFRLSQMFGFHKLATLAASLDCQGLFPSWFDQQCLSGGTGFYNDPINPTYFFPEMQTGSKKTELVTGAEAVAAVAQYLEGFAGDFGNEKVSVTVHKDKSVVMCQIH